MTSFADRLPQCPHCAAPVPLPAGRWECPECGIGLWIGAEGIAEIVPSAVLPPPEWEPSREEAGGEANRRMCGVVHRGRTG